VATEIVFLQECTLGNLPRCSKWSLLQLTSPLVVFKLQWRGFGCWCRCLGSSWLEMALRNGVWRRPGSRLAASRPLQIGKTVQSTAAKYSRTSEDADTPVSVARLVQALARAGESQAAKHGQHARAKPKPAGVGPSSVVAAATDGPGARWRAPEDWSAGFSRRGTGPGGAASVMARQCQRPVGRTRQGRCFENSCSPWRWARISRSRQTRQLLRRQQL